MTDRYIILTEGVEHDCCYSCRVVDTAAGKEDFGDYWKRDMCVCGDEVEAKEICAALNATALENNEPEVLNLAENLSEYPPAFIYINDKKITGSYSINLETNLGGFTIKTTSPDSNIFEFLGNTVPHQFKVEVKNGHFINTCEILIFETVAIEPMIDSADIYTIKARILGEVKTEVPE